MHAQRIIQDLLAEECPSMHAKRRDCVAVMVDAANRGGLGLLKMSKAVQGKPSLRHRIKRCDRLLSNAHLTSERILTYRALAHRALPRKKHICILVDWSDLLPDASQHVLRAAVTVKGRAIVLYEEIHPHSGYGKASVHRSFMETLRTVLPAHCEPVIVSDAGFRSPWFKMLDKLGFAWIGRVRNTNMARAAGKTDVSDWHRCKELYADTKGRARDLGQFDFTKTNPVPCRLVLFKGTPKGRQCKTAFGKESRSARSNKQRKGQNELWLLAVSPGLSTLSPKAVVAVYNGRMQIEQTFRDLKSLEFGMGISTSQTREPRRLAILLLIAALLGFALWLIGLAARSSGYNVGYGSKKKAATTLSILSLARLWLKEMNPRMLSQHQLNDALNELVSMVAIYEI